MSGAGFFFCLFSCWFFTESTHSKSSITPPILGNMFVISITIKKMNGFCTHCYRVLACAEISHLSCWKCLLSVKGLTPYRIRASKANHLVKEWLQITTTARIESLALFVSSGFANVHPDETSWEERLILSFKPRFFINQRHMLSMKDPYTSTGPNLNLVTSYQQVASCIQKKNSEPLHLHDLAKLEYYISLK